MQNGSWRQISYLSNVSLDFFCFGVPHGIFESRQSDSKTVEAVIGPVNGEDGGSGVGLGHPAVPLQDNDLGPDFIVDWLPLVEDFLYVILERKRENIFEKKNQDLWQDWNFQGFQLLHFFRSSFPRAFLTFPARLIESKIGTALTYDFFGWDRHHSHTPSKITLIDGSLQENARFLILLCKRRMATPLTNFDLCPPNSQLFSVFRTKMRKI